MPDQRKDAMENHIPREEQWRQLQERLESLEKLVQGLVQRVYQLERHREGKQEVAPDKIPPWPSAAADMPPVAPIPVALPPLPEPPPFRQASAMSAAQKRREVESLESKIGGNWLNKIGMVALILGMVYFLKYAIDNQWIGETGRVALGILTGLGLLSAGEALQKKDYRGYGLTLCAGGIAILYFSVFAAFNFYSLLPQLPAFFLMALITVTAVTMAVRYDSKVIAFLGILGGFLTPVMLSTGKDNQLALFAYLALLDLGILGLAYFKNWRVLNLLAFFLTQLTFLAWASSFYTDAKLWRTELFLALFFLIFAVMAFLYNIVHRLPTCFRDQFLIFLNGSTYFLWTYALLESRYFHYLGLYAVLMAVVYLALGLLVRKRSSEDNYLFLLLLGIALTCLTLAIPIQLKQHWITVGWAMESVVLSWIGFKVNNEKTRFGALLVLLLVLVRLLFLDSAIYPRGTEGFLFLWNQRGFVFAAGILALAGTALLYRRSRELALESERLVPAVLAVLANFLVVFFFTTEIHYYFRFQSATPMDWSLRRILASQEQLAISGFWALYSVLLVTLGILRRAREIRFLAIALFGLTILKVFIFDLAQLEKIYRIFSFLGLGVVLLLVSFFYQKYRSTINEFMMK
jgi:uncharacterized membrane protein